MLRTQVSEPGDEGALAIYADGSMRAASAWRHRDDGDEEVWDHALPATIGATNNEMNLEAPSAALELATSRHTPFGIARFDKIV